MESSYYGLKPNYNKCINLTTNRQTSTIKYRDGSKVPRSSRVVYLGTSLTDTQTLWDKANTTTAWKLRVYNAIVKTKLLYSLETIQLTKSELSKIDAFQMKGLRRILKIPSTYIDRTHTNDVVLQKRTKRAFIHKDYRKVGKNKNWSYLDTSFVQTIQTHDVKYCFSQEPTFHVTI